VIRLFVPDDLHAGTVVATTAEQTHYLSNVMRLAKGALVALFNGRDGEWSAVFVRSTRRDAILTVQTLLRPQSTAPDLELIVALVKRARLETIIEKAAELGARRVRLITTARTNTGHTNVVRLAAIAVEAAEQTGRMDVPQVLAPQKLAAVLAGWPSGRGLMFCDEAGEARSALEALERAEPGPWSILIGPEGGFSAEERVAVRSLPETLPVGLGPRILRADTAAISALSLWQARIGDWRGP
jgi:16S rRNA (uracil1498-N3)-methyltransferase